MAQTKKPNQVVPTGDIRHTAAIREGKQSAEVFCKNNDRRYELGLPPIIRSDDEFAQDLRK